MFFDLMFFIFDKSYQSEISRIKNNFIKNMYFKLKT